MHQYIVYHSTFYANDSGLLAMTGKKCVGSVKIFEVSQKTKNKIFFGPVNVLSIYKASLCLT